MQLNAVSEDSKERKESLVEQIMQRNRGKKNRLGKTKHFMQRWVNKGQKRKGPNRSRRD